ncbi:MAG: iron-sulfur cluster co-chaperone HscB C-terminal domain-containing protein [Phycisphaerales bacterium]|nr:iron-sulfur cluster co-chaperone HscB C-terminal domain-containing protein [Phycisphaerales bacterium]
MADAFDLLGLEARFDLTPERVRAAYLARAGAVHPDAVPGGEDGAAAALNAAKTAVSDPETRANLLLARLGGASSDVSRALPDGFLMKMMEAREGMEEAASRRDGAAIERWRGWAERERDGHIARVGALLEAARLGKPTGVGLSEVRQELNAWRYIERMLEQIGEL